MAIVIDSLKCVCIYKLYGSTSRAFTVTDCGRRVRRCSLGFPCVLNDVCISVNCIMANQLIFSTEPRVFIYDQILSTQSASQVRRVFENWCMLHH